MEYFNSPLKVNIKGLIGDTSKDFCCNELLAFLELTQVEKSFISYFFLELQSKRSIATHFKSYI